MQYFSMIPSPWMEIPLRGPDLSPSDISPRTWIKIPIHEPTCAGPRTCMHRSTDLYLQVLGRKFWSMGDFRSVDSRGEGGSCWKFDPRTEISVRGRDFFSVDRNFGPWMEIPIHGREFRSAKRNFQPRKEEQSTTRGIPPCKKKKDFLGHANLK